MIFADVIVNISHDSLDRPFCYIVPERLAYDIVPGSVVSIPFGRSNKIIKGYVIGLADKPSIEISKIKEIADVDKKDERIETKLIALAFWMKKRYGSTMNAALKTVLPVKRKVEYKKEKSVCLRDEKLAREKLSTLRASAVSQKKLLEEMINVRQLPYETVRDKLKISPSAVKALEAAGIIEIKSADFTAGLFPKGFKDEKPERKLELNDEQRAVVADIRASKKGVHLIRGVTGSGKTEVYMELIAATLDEGKQAIVLIPEIALTYQTLKRFYERFGERVAAVNSRLSSGEKYERFSLAREGKLDIMIGPRSALFCPFKNPGLIIVDEEHDTSYKSELSPGYETVECAVKYGELTGAKVVLGSATPQVASFYKAKRGEYGLCVLNDRAAGAEKPDVTIVDMRTEFREKNYSIFSRRLLGLIDDRLQKKEQVMIFLNRRGYSGFISCRECGEVISCPHCSVSLKLHKNGRLVCHYCGYEQKRPARCPKCGSKKIGGFGVGTEAVEEQLHMRFPQAKIQRMDADTTARKDDYQRILSAFAARETDILVGTQMIVKGHDFPFVTLVGILCADLSLHANDYMAAERTFDLLTQASGRAGRGNRKGEAIIQTYSPDHYAIKAAANQDYEAFYNEEIAFRRELSYPPVREMTALLLSSRDENALRAAAQMCADAAREAAGAAGKTTGAAGEASAAACEGSGDMIIVGPSCASVFKINDEYRMVIYIKGTDESATEMVVCAASDVLSAEKFKNVFLKIDVNPRNMY